MRWLKRIWRFFWDKITEVLAGGLITITSLGLYFWLQLSGSIWYDRGLDLNLVMLKHLADNTPDLYGWNIGGMFRNMARGQNAEKILFFAEIVWMVTFIFFAIRRTVHHCRRLLRRGVHKDTDAPQEETLPLVDTQSNPTKGVTTMRLLGRFYSAIADLLWLLTVFAFVFLLVPQIRGLSPDVLSTPVPVQGGVTIAKLLVQFMPLFLMALVLFNVLAGRWAPADEMRRNLWVSRLAFAALAILLVLTGIINKWVTGLPEDLDTLVKIGAFGSAAFAFIDMMYTKGSTFRASSLQDPNYIALQDENRELRARLQGQLGAFPASHAPSPATAPAGFALRMRPVVLPPVYLKPGQTVSDVDGGGQASEPPMQPVPTPA